MGVKFENVDILDFLKQIMDLNTQHYKDDFELDKELIQNLAGSSNPEERCLLWMSRPNGTYCLWERETYLEGTYENKVWRYYHEQTKDFILAYALRLDGIQEGKVVGDIYSLDYHSHVERVKLLSCPVERVAVYFKDGTKIILPNDSCGKQIRKYEEKYGTPKSFRYLPEYDQELEMILRKERFKRNYAAKTGDIQEYIDGLKKDTMRGRLKRSKESEVAHKSPQHKDGPEL